MMEPVIQKAKINGYRINPNGSIVSGLGFDHAFTINDYIGQFRERDQEQFNAIKAIEEEQPLRE